MSYALAFDPLNPKNNLVPAELLQHPFPYDRADAIPWNLTPVTDDSPYFGMIRKFNGPIVHGAGNVIDFNSAYLLNERLQKGVPKDWFHLFVVAIVSMAFAMVFLLVPFLVTNLRHARWNGMSYDISYFACLGLGFILIQVAFIQLFNKLIGFPTHTFVAVVFSMLLSAGLGSGYSARFAVPGASRWRVVFYAVVAYTLVFALSYKAVFHAALGLPLAGRLAVAVALIAPLGFLLGMPFPLGIERLARRSNAAVSWAWAVNGFFTVVGGYLALIVSIRYGFSAVLYLATAVYGLAYLLHRRVRALPVEAPLPAAAAQSSAPA
jgi:hypothetical protein